MSEVNGQRLNVLPSGWQKIQLGKVCKLKNGFAFRSEDYKKGGIPVIRISDIRDGRVEVTDSVQVIPKEDYKDFIVEEGDILVAISGATTGKFGIYKTSVTALKKKIEKDAYGGAQPNISSKKIEEMQITIAPIEVQKRIVSRIEELFSELDKSIEQLKTAQQQVRVFRQSVLKWAFEGKLTNKQAKKGELPKEWKTIRLNELCKIIGGVTKGRDFKGKQTIQLPYLRVANVQDGYLNLKEIKTIEVLPSDKEKYKLEYGDILYTEGGDKDKLGRGTIWKNEIEGCIHQNHVFRARPLSKEIDSKYLAFYSQTKSAKNYFFKHGKQTTNLASINLTVLSNLPVPICSYEEQQQIVREIESRLSIADKVEETIVNSLAQAEALRQSILKKGFEGKLQ
jgi:type I restriction enzyme, S subunit